MVPLRTIALPHGETLPVLGQGTWGMAMHRQNRADEIASLQTAVDLGMTVIDTAEMYADGGAEELVAQALGHRRGEIFLVSKVMPQNASRRKTLRACEDSLRRLKTDCLDLYLLHWRGSVPLEETLDAFSTLKRDGKIRHWGVSNFDVEDMDELVALPATGRSASAGLAVAINQVLYNLVRRGIEYELLPWCRERRIPVMAYSPLEQGKLVDHQKLTALGDRLGATAGQVALAWVLHQPGVIAIPKAGRVSHVRENKAALDIQFAPGDLGEIDPAFSRPARRKPLEMI